MSPNTSGKRRASVDFADDEVKNINKEVKDITMSESQKDKAKPDQVKEVVVDGTLKIETKEMIIQESSDVIDANAKKDLGDALKPAD